MKIYILYVVGLIRELFIIKFFYDLLIVSFVILGDIEIVKKIVFMIVKKLLEVDFVVIVEVKGILLVYEIFKVLNLDEYIVVRKSVKVYMEEFIEVEFYFIIIIDL